MSQVVVVRDIMISKVLTVKDDDSLQYVAELFEKYDYDGLPVVDKENTLVGIITAYDMVVQSSGMHLPTVLNILGQISVNQADKKQLAGHFEKLKQIKAREIMNTDPLTISADLSIEDAAKNFAEHHKVNPLIVIDENKKLLGVVSRYDVIKFFNEKYFNQVLEATNRSDTVMGEARSGVEKEVESTVGDLSKKFLLVGNIRPKLWKVAAVAMFIAGFIGAMALIIRIVKKQDEYNFQYRVKIASSVGFESIKPFSLK